MSRLAKIAKNLIDHNPELADCKDIQGKIAVSLLMAHLIPADGKVPASKQKSAISALWVWVAVWVKRVREKHQ